MYSKIHCVTTGSIRKTPIVFTSLTENVKEINIIISLIITLTSRETSVSDW